MLITVSIANIRNLSMIALFGTHMIFFFVIGTIFFLLPIGFIAAILTAEYHDDGGIYVWVKKAFGSHFGFLAIWLQWVNTLVWYPTTLSFIAGSIVYALDPSAAQNPWILITLICSTFWLLTIMNLYGLNTSAVFASLCAILGLLIPFSIILILVACWIASGHPLYLNFNTSHLLPSFHSSQSWVSIVAIITSFLGMELISVHVNRFGAAAQRLPSAILASSGLILLIMLLGSLAVAAILPANHISLVAGIMQVFHQLLLTFHLLWLQPILAILLVVGAVGSMINWIISPAQGLLQASTDGYLPTYLCYQNKHKVPSRILIIQAVVVSATACVFLFMPSINASYWLLTDLSTELYLSMYTMMLLAAIALALSSNLTSILSRKLGGRYGIYLLSTCGLIGCVITLVVGFIPPQLIHTGSHGHYAIIFGSGLLLLLAPCSIAYIYRSNTTTID